MQARGGGGAAITNCSVGRLLHMYVNDILDVYKIYAVQ